MEELTPNTRYEKFLAAAAGNEQRPDPVTRDEKFLAALSGDYNAPEPVTRDEKMLAYAAGNHDAITPNTRHEKFIAALFGDIDVPEPITREEKFWSEIAQNAEKTLGPASIVSFIGRANTEILALTAAITPIQDLHGYDNPWPAGGGVSKCPSFANGTHTMKNGLTVTIQDGEITINGTASGSGYYEEDIESTVMPADAYVSFNNPVGTFNIAYVFIHGSTQIAAPSLSPANGTKQPTGLSGATVNKLRIFCNAGTYDNFKMSPIVHDGSTPQAWQPYANICPISGRSGLNVYVSPTEDIADATAYAEDWTSEAGTVYGGTVDVVSGILKAKPYIASYNGETLVGPWVSSMDAYAAGTTPTTGAQVVDLGGTETEYTLTPQTVTALLGQNYVWADTGDVTVTVKGAKTSA